MDLRLKITETALSGVEQTLTDFRNALLDFSNVDKTDELEVQDIQEMAYRSLRSLEGHLNTDINGEFLFSGARTTNQPVDFDIASLAILQDRWNGESIKYPTYAENNIHPKLTASTGAPDDPDNVGFSRLTFAGGLGGTITSDENGYQTDTITLAGTVQDGDQYKITVDGTTVTYTVTGAEADLAAVTTNIIAAINAEPTVSAVVDATAGNNTGEIILTADTPGTSFTSSVTASNLPPIAQVSTATIAGTPQVGDQYSVTVDAIAVTYTVTGLEGSLDAVKDAFITQINNHGTVGNTVTATDSATTGEIILTAQSTNTAFTISGGAVDIGNVAQVETVTISTGTSEAGDVFTTTVDGVAYPYTSVGPESETTIANGLAALINANPNLTAANVAGVITITATAAGTAYTSASTVVTDFDSGGDALTATDAVTQANITANADNTTTIATTQVAEAGIQPAVAQVDNIALTGTYSVSDTVSVNVNGVGAVTYTVVANDLTANGDGTGGVATDTQAQTNIAAKIATALAANAATAAVATATSSGTSVVLTSTTAGTALSTVSTATDAGSSGGGQTATVSTTTANFEGGIPAVAQVDNVTLTGVFAAGDDITVNVDSIGLITYTVTADDLTANGNGSGGAVAGDSAAAYNYITTNLAAAINADASTAAVVTAAATGGGGGVVTLTADTTGTAFSAVSGETTAGTGVATQTTATANVVEVISNTDNAATLVSVAATQNPFSNIPVGAHITIANATNTANNTTFTVAANTGSVITVSSTDTVVDSSGYDLSGTLTITTDISYYSGDENTTTHKTSKNRDFTLDTNALDPAFEKAIRSMFIIAQGVYGTDGGLDNNTTRVEDALYLVRSALDANVGGTPPYGAEASSNMEKVQTDIAYHRILIDQTNSLNQDLIDFYDTEVIGVENIDQLAVITKLLDDQQSLEASYQSMARIRQLSLINFL